MIIGFIKAAQTYVAPQVQRKRFGQGKRIEGFRYSFITTLCRADMSFDDAYQMILRCLLKFLGIPFDEDKEIENIIGIKDIELSLDVRSDHYTINFFADKDLPENDYAAETIWKIVDCSNGDELTETDFPTVFSGYIRNNENNRYDIKPLITALSSEDLEQISS